MEAAPLKVTTNMFFYTSQSNESLSRLSLTGYSRIEVIACLVVLALIWNCFRAIYLIYFHPLASFPGPRRAAISSLWLYSRNKSGEAEEAFEELHKQYNTRALRIAPNEIHITDPTLYHTIYSQRHTFTKQKYFYDTFNSPHSVFVETDIDLHRQRRKLLSSFFSKTSIRSMEGVLTSKVKLLCERISETRANGPINLYCAFRCLTVDFITAVAFGQSFNLLTKSAPNTFAAPFLRAFDLAGSSLWDLMHFPFLRVIVKNAPPAVLARLNEPVANFQGLIRAVSETVKSFRALHASGKTLEHEVMFDRMADLDDELIRAEASDILAAGSDTTATTLAVAMEEMVRRPAFLERLREELRDGGMAAEQDCELSRLERLPYLSACVKEALRYAMAVPGRLPRIVPQLSSKAEPLIVDDKAVPPGAVVSMSAYTIHFDESIWGADARSFKPERWLFDDAKHLEKYLVTFSKGARQCIGMNLAYAEITLTLAMLVTRFRFTADETLKEIDTKRIDNFTVAFEGTGFRANVHEVSE